MVNGVDLPEVERELCRLPGVTGARIVSEAGRPTEVHVLARPGKPAKQIVRDVQSVALASFGLELDRRIISVVQLDADPAPGRPADGSPPTAEPAGAEPASGEPAGQPGSPAAAPAQAPERASPGPSAPEPSISATARAARDDTGDRPALCGITSEAGGLRTLYRVTLAVDGREAVGFAEGTIAAAARHRLVATATLDALRQLNPAAECLDVDAAHVLRVGMHDIAVVTVVAVVPPDEQFISGSAFVRSQRDLDAVARATLDATNRRLPRLG